MDVLTVFFLLLCVGHCHGQSTKRKLTRLRLDVDYLSDVAVQLKLDIDDLQAWRNATPASSRERDVIDSNTDLENSQFLRSCQQALDDMEGRVKYILHGLEGEKMALREVMEDIRENDAKLNQHILTAASMDTDINEQLHHISEKLDTSIGELSNRLDQTTKSIGDISDQVTHLSKQPSTNVPDNTGTTEPRTEEYYARMKKGGWLRYNNNLYKLSERPLNFSTAVESCKSIGASLVEITDMAELQFLRDNFGGNNFWVGASDRETEGEWRWLSDQLVKDGNWSPGQPNDHDGTQDCLLMVRYTGFKYFDFWCSRIYSYLCKMQ